MTFSVSCFSAQRFDSWVGFSPSTSSLSRGSTGVTHPIAEQLPSWAKANVFDSDLITQNPALLSLLGTDTLRTHPVVVRSTNAGGVYSATESLAAVDLDTDALANRISAAQGIPQVSKLEVSSRWLSDEAGFSFNFNQHAQAELFTNGSMEVIRYRDFAGLLAVGGVLFDRDEIGHMEIGTGIKAIFRQGNEAAYTSEQVLAATPLVGAGAASTKWALAGGLDYGWLYGAPRDLVGDWALQMGIGWRDVGTTQFFLGQKTSKGRRFQALPNNIAVGFGVGTPKIFRGIRNALRVEYLDWNRQAGASEKIAIGWEFRLPVLLSLNAGLKGGRGSGGLLLRYEGVEVGVGSYSELIGDNSVATRFWVLEMRGVL